MSNANLEMATWALHAKDQEARVEELEDLLEEIKLTIQSELISAQGKLNIIWRDIQDAS